MTKEMASHSENRAQTRRQTLNPGGAEVGSIQSLTVSLPPLKAETLTPQQILGPILFLLFVFRIIIWTKKAPVLVGFAITRMEPWVLTPQQAPGRWWRG